MAKVLHPDHGGLDAHMQRLNAAYEAAKDGRIAEFNDAERMVSRNILRCWWGKLGGLKPTHPGVFQLSLQEHQAYVVKFRKQGTLEAIARAEQRELLIKSMKHQIRKWRD
jgi:putative component of toxin-antitoxin plasmid stabilization module